MTEPSLRLLLVIGTASIVALLAWSGSRRHLAKPEKTVRTDLPPGVHFFSSETCLSCAKARRLLERLAPGHSEIRFEDDPPRFASFAIAQVPTVIVVDESGDAVMFEGVPQRSAFQKVLRGT